MNLGGNAALSPSIPTVGDALRAVAAGLSDRLVSPAALRRLTELGDLLPVTTGGIIECHLGSPSKVDLGVRVLQGDGSLDVLAGRHHDRHHPMSLLAAPAWRRLRDFAQGCCRGELPLGVRYLWLEFDTDRDQAALRPSVFFDPGQGGSTLPADELADRVADTAAVLLVESPSADYRRQLTRCLAALPAGAGLAYVGLMFARGAREIRLTLNGLTPGDLTVYADRVGWPGDPLTSLIPFERRLEGTYAQLTLNVDVGVVLGPTLGLEVADPRDVPGGGRLMASLVTAGLVPEAIPRALLLWPGLSVPRGADGRWPGRLREACNRIVRRTNHIKFTIVPDAPPGVKAYLYYGLLGRGGRASYV